MPAAGLAPPTVWFLSDYGLDDEFVGICHAVVRRAVPGLAVVDLTHGIPPFDIRAGSAALVRCVPHLGPGAVLAVVDPGVGGVRRGVAVELPAGSGPRWLVGPDNGLLIAAAGVLGGARRAWALHRPAGPPVTFDGRDVFAPAAALLCHGADPEDLGDPLGVGELAPLDGTEPAPELSAGRLRAAVSWVDRYGNVQLGAPAGALPDAGPLMVTVGGRPSVGARRVSAFSDLEPGELGVLADANGRPSVVVREGSAAAVLGTSSADVVILTW